MRKLLLITLLLLFGVCLNVAAQEVAVYLQLGHTGGISSVAFSPDGKQILSGSGDGTVKLWDTESGREIRTFGHTGRVNSVAFSPNGKQALSCSSGFYKKIKLWDVASGNEIRTFGGHEFSVLSIAFSPDGKQILSGSSGADCEIILWDVASGREIRTFSGLIGGVNSLTFSPDGKQFLSDSGDGTLLWDVASGRKIRTFSSDATSVAFSPDGKQFLSGSDDGTVKLWDVSIGRVIRTLSGHTDRVGSVAFSPDGKQVLSCSDDSSMKLWDAASGREIRTFSGDTSWVSSVAFSPDGKYVLSGSSKLILWDVSIGRVIRTLSGHTDRVGSVAFGPDGKQVLFGSYDTVKLWDAATGRDIRTFSGHTDGVTSVAFSPDGKQVLSGSGDSSMKLWDAASGREIRTFSGHKSGVASVAFSLDGKQLLSYSWDGVKLWDVANGREIRTFPVHTGWVDSVAFSPDGKQVLSGSWDSLKLWDVASGQEIRTFSSSSGYISVKSVVFSPDGKYVLSGGSFNELKLWDTATGREVRTFSESSVNFISIDLIPKCVSVAFSPDGKQILSGSSDKTIKLWDVASWREIRTFAGHEDAVTSLAFSPDGRQVLSGSNDGTVRLWDVSTGKEIAQFISFKDGEWIVITPDGYYNASPNGDKYLNVRVGNNVYGIDQYRSTFYNRQIVEARLQGRPDPVLVTTTIQEIADKTPPDVVIRNPENRSDLTTNQVKLTVTIIDQRQPIRTVKVLVNGRLLGADSMRGSISVKSGELELENTQIRLTGNQHRAEFELPVSLDPGRNIIEVIADNPYSSGKDSVEVTNKQVAAQNTKPNLWILSIGINRYDSQNLPKLDYAVNDARAIIEAFKTQEGKRYGKVNSLLIADGTAVAPTKDNIINNFSRYFRQAGADDVKMLFIAGHGLTDEGGFFYFMPSDAAFDADGSILPSKAISYREIQSVLDRPGQKLVFIDACHSAGTNSGLAQRVNNDRMVNDLKNNNLSISSSSIIFTSSRGDQSSLESDTYKHGIFTYAILQGLKGEADLTKEEAITTTALELYIKKKIPELARSANRQQEPYISRPDGYVDFVVAELK
jgi:WD40 repeat protein/uncharacterized caspase-like protein